MLVSKQTCFRPLLGAYFFIVQNNSNGSKNYLFPSPIRGLFFYRGYEHDKDKQSRLVSVPYSGLIFLFLRPCLDDYPFAEPFPSPTRGLFFYKERFTSLEQVMHEFPSPTRGLFFYEHVDTDNRCKWNSFRPLLGAYFFMVTTCNRLKADDTASFRPLLGAYFFIKKSKQIAKAPGVSVPYSGLIFL